jgi:DNA mismatch repair protein MLH1
LDAGATSINIIVKNGGISFIQIQDNGHGIRKEDLEIVCERFTTSKLHKFEDLQQISTFGFRGEALASISHVARVQILSRTANSSCAYRVHYRDGKPVPHSNNNFSSSEFYIPCAGVIGTTITIEDLFYNMPTRRSAFKNFNEEYRRIVDVVAKYAILYGEEGISFSCKKFGSQTFDFSVSPQFVGNGIFNAWEAAIRTYFGSDVSKSLIPVSTEGIIGTSYKFSIRGRISNPSYSGKKSIFVLFINNRLVDSFSIKKSVETVYDSILPRHCFPFVFLSIR